MSGRKKASRKEKARKRSGGNEAETKGSTGGTAVGAKPGGTKGNEQNAKYEEPGKKVWETRLGRTGKTEEARAETEHRMSHCEAETGRTERKKQRLSSRKRNGSDRKETDGKRKIPNKKGTQGTGKKVST